MTTLDVQTFRLAIFADVMTDDAAAELLPAIASGVRVTLFVSDRADRVSGVVAQVYTDAAGTTIAELRLSSGAIALRSIEHLTVVSPR